MKDNIVHLVTLAVNTRFSFLICLRLEIIACLSTLALSLLL